MAKRPTVAEVLRSARLEMGQSLRSAAADLAVDPAHLSRIEAGLKTPSDELQRRAADYYALDADQLHLAAGTVPADILEILRSDPSLLEELRGRRVRQR